MQASTLTRSLREPGGPCTKSMEVSESRMERVNRCTHKLYIRTFVSANMLLGRKIAAQMKMRLQHFVGANLHLLYLYSAIYRTR